MLDRGRWSWEQGRRPIGDLGPLGREYPEVHELVVSPDGERIAAPVVKAPDAFGVWVNGELWEGEFEKAWHLELRARRPPDRAGARSTTSGRWRSTASRGRSAASSPGTRKFSRDGSAIAVQVKRGHGVHASRSTARPGSSGFLSCRGLRAQPTTASTVAAAGAGRAAPRGRHLQVPGGHLERRGGRRAVGAAGSSTSTRRRSARTAPRAAEVRLGHLRVHRGRGRRARGSRASAASGSRATGRAAAGSGAPVRTGGAWTLAENGAPALEGPLRAAVAPAPEPGRRAASRPWSPPASAAGRSRSTTGRGRRRSATLVLPPVFSPDGRRVAAAVKDEGRWSIAVDGAAWPRRFDMVWDPVFSPDGRARGWPRWSGTGATPSRSTAGSGAAGSSALWDPVFSPDGQQRAGPRGRGRTVSSAQVVPLGDARAG